MLPLRPGNTALEAVEPLSRQYYAARTAGAAGSLVGSTSFQRRCLMALLSVRL